MAKKSLKEISKAMRKLDICMMSTVAGNELDSRPMSNNREVDYNGNSYFFTEGKSRLVKELTRNSNVNLAYNGKNHLYISVLGKAKLVKSMEAMAEHWSKDLDLWFKDGIQTPGLTMIHVKAKKIRYWDKMKEGEISLR